MNIQQFKAWFEGFSENIGTEPTPKQWAKIKAKIHELREETPMPYAKLEDYPRYKWGDSISAGFGSTQIPLDFKQIGQNDAMDKGGI